MNFLTVISALCLAAYANAQCAPGYYQIKSGDTFYALGGNNWGGACAWLSANPTVNPCNLQIGQCVAAPSYGSTTYCPSASTNSNIYNAYNNCFNGYNTNSNYYGSGYYSSGTYYGCPAGQYQIKSGDTFYALGGNNWGGACAWLSANPNVNPCNLQVGQCVAAPTSTTSSYCPSASTNSNIYNAYNNCFSGYNSNPYYYGSGTYNGYSYGCPAGFQQIVSGNTFYALGGNTWGGACAWLNANPGVDPCNLQVGQCVRAPLYGYTSTYCSASYSCYNGNYGYSGNYYYTPNPYGYSYSSGSCYYGQRTIASGNTFWNLGGSTNAGACAWMAANPGVDPCCLQVGKCLNEPTYADYWNPSCTLPTCTGGCTSNGKK